MKTKRFLIAALLVTTIASVAVVSCKKETPEATTNNNKEEAVFRPENITDMNAYLKGFKKQMQESKSNETISLEEAASPFLRENSGGRKTLLKVSELEKFC
jgi:flagellar motor component MotA